MEMFRQNNVKSMFIDPNLLTKPFNADRKVAVQPYLVFLRCLGIAYWPNSHGVNPWQDPWIIYCFLIMVQCWIPFLMCWELMPLEEDTTSLVAFLNAIVCVLKDVVAFMALFILALSKNGLVTFFALCEQLKLRPDRQVVFNHRVRMSSWAVLCIFVLLSMVQLSAYISAISMRFYGGPDFTRFSSIVVILRTLNIFLNVHVIGFIVIMCITLCLLFYEVNLTLAEGFQKPDFNINTLKAFSSLFRHGIKIVAACDRILSFVVGPYLMSYICQMIFNTYFLIDGVKYLQSFTWYWMTESVLTMVFLLVFPAFVNMQAHKSYEVLCSAEIENMDVPLQLIIIGLQNRLTNSSIGLSVCGIRVLTKSFIPSVITVYLTYIFLLIQFKTK